MPRSKSISDLELLDALLPTVLRIGVHRVTLADLGDVVRLSPATLIQRFGSRQALLDAVLDRSTDQLEAHLGSVLEFEADQFDQPRRLFAWLASITEPLGDRALLAGNLGVLARDVSEPDRRVQAARRQGMVRDRIWRSLVATRHPAGQVPGVAEVFEAHWHGLVIQWALTGDGELPAFVEAGLWRLWHALARQQQA